jgi:hypothetical protein
MTYLLWLLEQMEAGGSPRGFAGPTTIQVAIMMNRCERHPDFWDIHQEWWNLP